MNKELIDKAWACLPREFKEEVKYKYNKTKTKKIKKECDLGFLNAHEGMFGVHNLTSYTEGEEMLTVSRKKVQEEYAIISEELSYHDAGTKDYTAWHYIKMIFEEFFGSKCLPDEEPKPAEPTANYIHSEGDLNTAVLTDKCSSASTCDKRFDNILKDSFREHNRLHIAAQIVAALYANHQAAKGFKSIEELVRKALDIANALIKESEKGGVAN